MVLVECYFSLPACCLLAEDDSPRLGRSARGQERKALWRERKEALWSMMGLYPDLFPMVTDVCVPVSRLAELITESKEQLDASPLPTAIVAHAVSQPVPDAAFLRGEMPVTGVNSGSLGRCHGGMVVDSP